MSAQITFTVRGIPKPQPRPRAAFNGRTGHARVFESGTAEAWKCDVVRDGDPHRPPIPLTGPLRVDIDFLLPRPKRLCRKKDPVVEIYADGRANDRDNLDKAVLDAMTLARFWEDDGQVVDGRIRKLYHAVGEGPGARITITTLGDRP